jgi:hypothetical protein
LRLNHGNVKKIGANLLGCDYVLTGHLFDDLGLRRFRDFLVMRFLGQADGPVPFTNL